MFYLRFDFDFCVSQIMHLWARNLPRKPNNYVSEKPMVMVLLAVPGRLFCFGALVVLDVLFGYVLFFVFLVRYKNIEKGKK